METSSGENMLPSPSMRHSTNGFPSCVNCRSTRYCDVADTINGSVRLELSRSSLAPPPVSLPLFSIPTPTCGLLDRNHLTVTFRKSKMGRRTPYRSTKPLLPVLILHSYPPDTCFARGWSGRDLPVGVEVGCSAVKSRSATNPNSPACRWCKAFLGKEKSQVDRVRRWSISARSWAERRYQISSFSPWFSDWVGSM